MVLDASAFRAAFDTSVLWGCGIGLGGIVLAALALGLSRCPARVRAAARRLGGPTVFVLGGFMAFATLEGSVTRAYKMRVSATLNACAEETQSVSEGRSQRDSERSELPARAREGFEERRHGERNEVSDRIDKIDRIAETGASNTPNPVNPVNPVEKTPCLPTSNNSAFSDGNLCFYGIEKGTSTVTLGVAWPGGLSPPNGRLDVFGNWRLAPDGWTRLAQVDVSGAQSPVAVEIGIDGFPTDAMARTAFFRLATQADTDGDGLCNADEQSLGTDPHAADSDGDGVSDFLEICNGSDPADGSDGGKPSAKFPNRGMRFDINGDYAAWSMTIVGLGPLDRLSDMFSMASPGVGSERLKVLKKGNSYRLTMQWLNSDGHTDPNWYCWQARVNGLPTAPSYESYETARLPGNEIVHGLGWMAENAGGLLTSHVHMREGKGGNVAEGLEATLHVYQCGVSICDPGDEAWPELAASRVLLDDEALRIRASVTPAIADFDLFRRVMGSNVVVSTSGTCPTGVAIPVAASEFFNYGTNSEIRMTRTRAQLIELGLLPSQDEDGVDEMAWIDMANLAADSGQNLSDSEAFSALGHEFRGKATLDSAKGLDSQPPNSIPSESFFKAAGCEVVSVEYGGVRSSKRQIMNQVDYFYYSGHGLHLYKSVDPGYGPETVNGHWNKDLKCVIFAACSILDINDYNNNYRWEPEEHNLSPGKYWESVGPSVLLGYNYYAPADSSGAPARIMRSWVANRELLGDVDAWMEANKEQKKWNACAIRKGGDYVYFDSFMSVIHIKKAVRKEDW